MRTEVENKVGFSAFRWNGGARVARVGDDLLDG